ncbi:MAG: aldose 1-epimerase [Acidobacteriota bacterium]|nr:aldose 1-epimerase [Acidobacteriota bacterium]
MKAILCAISLLILMSCSKPETAARTVEIGGEPVAVLTRVQSGEGLQFVGADVLPGRGMNTFQIRAYLPGKGVVNVLASPSLEEAQAVLNGGTEDMIGNKSFSFGGAILLPYANRITGTLSPDGKTIKTQVMGKEVMLPANWHGKNPGAPKYAMHGLILDAKMTDVQHDAHSVSGVYHAGNFGGRWVGSTDVHASVELQGDAFVLTVKATNVGQEPVPVGIGWHPYFALPSRDRTQARLHLPARSRGLVNNYDDVLPTGGKVPVAGTPYDFSAQGGAPLDKLFMDDTFIDLQKDSSGAVVAEIVDPAAKYGIRITAPAPQIHAVQVYAPVDKEFVVLEPQFNYAEPFSKIWGGTETGMQILQPGQTATYVVKLELFVP